jgi:predicted unusual protein kinase regulating ubiquinone biosynthesis (AarF/ABC1/UbiB family)
LENGDSESIEARAGREPTEIAEKTTDVPTTTDSAQSIHDAARTAAIESDIVEMSKKLDNETKASTPQLSSSLAARLGQAPDDQDFDAWLDELDAKLAAASALLDKAAEEKEAMHKVEAEIAAAQKLAAERVAKERAEDNNPHHQTYPQPGKTGATGSLAKTEADPPVTTSDTGFGTSKKITETPDPKAEENISSVSTGANLPPPVVSSFLPAKIESADNSTPVVAPSGNNPTPIVTATGSARQAAQSNKQSGSSHKTPHHHISGGAAAAQASTAQSSTGAPMYESELADEFVRLRRLAFDDRFWRMTRLVGEFARETAKNKWLPDKKVSQAERKRDLAVRFRNALVELGPTFIKLGQFLSVRRDLLDVEMADELATLQDNVPPFSAEQAIKTIATELGQEPDKLFLEFDQVPLASASIGQVHRARLHDGRQVVIKVQRPDLAAKFYQDLGYMRSLIRWGRRIRKEGDWDGWLALSDEFGRSLFSEIDYIQEGKNADRMRLNLRDSTHIRIPRVIWKYTGRHVLAFEYVPGIKIDKINELKERSFDLVEIGNQLVYAYLEQVLIHGYFHADPHAGNLAIDDEGRIIIYDFGMVGEISEAQRLAIAGCVTSVIDKSGEDVAQYLVELGVLTADSNKAPVVRTLTPFIDYYSGKSMKDLDFNHLERDIDQIALERALRLPANLAYLLRAGSSVEGIARTLQPEFSFVEAAKPFIQRWLLSKPTAFGALLKIFLKYSREAYRTGTERLTSGSGIFGFGKKRGKSHSPETQRAQPIRPKDQIQNSVTGQAPASGDLKSIKVDNSDSHSTSLSSNVGERKIVNALSADPPEDWQNGSSGSSGSANLALERDRQNQQRQIYLLETRLEKSVRLLMVLGCSAVGSLVFSSLFLIASFLADYRSYAHYFLIGNGVMGAIILWHLVEAALLGKKVQGKR